MPNKQPPIEHQFKKGQSGNPKGRPQGTLKDYDRKKFREMSEEKKEEFLKSIPNEMRYRMAEGNPENQTDITSKGEPIFNAEKQINKIYGENGGDSI